MDDKPVESWRARANVAEALDVFNSSYMQEIWSKALARRVSDPEAAVTSARTLLESVCRHILDDANVHVREGAPLPILYAETAKLLEIAPNDNLAQVLNTMFTACVEAVASIGKLRNELSDSHGRGQFGAMPEWRHSELAVNLSGAVATYLAAVWKGRQPTVADVIRAFMAGRGATLSHPAKYSYERMARDLNDVIASKIRASDLASYFEERAARDNLAPATIKREFGFLRVVLGPKSAQAVSKAQEILRQKGLIVDGHVSRLRRVRHEDVDAMLEYLREQAPKLRANKYPEAVRGVVDVVEFAVWSGVKLIDIFKLKWADVDFERKTCKLPGQEEPFPVLERAWELIEERRQSAGDMTGRIFPENHQAVAIRHLNAVNALREAGKIQVAPRFHDYRYEAAYRLLEKGHPVTVVARATRQPPERILKIAEDVGQHAKV